MPLQDLPPQVQEGLTLVASSDSLTVMRMGAPILFSLGISDPVHWWGDDPSDLGRAIRDRAMSDGRSFRPWAVQCAVELRRCSAPCVEPAVLAAYLMRAAAVELIRLRGAVGADRQVA